MGNTVESCKSCDGSDLRERQAHLERVAVHPRGPEFPYRCGRCGALWRETLRSVVRVSVEDARASFPDFTPR